MTAPPSGTVTFLLTDIEGSTRLWEQQPEAMRSALMAHDQLLRSTVEAAGGYVFSTGGDSFAIAFGTAGTALATAVAVQLGQTAAGGLPLRVRIAIHTGEADERAGDYFGPSLNRGSRLLSAAHGGQILLSAATAQLTSEYLPPGVWLDDAGEHRLRDLSRPERIFVVRHPDLPASFPPLRTLDITPHNLPVQATSFVGRDNELAGVEELLGSSRLVTFTGIGGTGKSRLAMQAAARRSHDYPAGVWWVELAPVTSPTSVAEQVARTLRIAEHGGMPLLSAIADQLSPGRALLILDNCEHVREAASELVQGLLARLPQLSVLATSRELLGLSGEAVYPVPPMTIPERQIAADRLRSADSVALFAQAAHLAHPGFRITDGNAGQVADICRRLDGLPLAIELAAAKLRVLSLAEIGARLTDRFHLLADTARTGEARHRTLRAALDWSYELLTEQERRLLARLSVYRGSFLLESAETIGGFEPLRSQDVLELLSALVGKSLVIFDLDAGRYRLLETVRQYAWERAVEAGEADEIGERHAHLLLSVITENPGEDKGVWLDRVKADHDDLRAALGWAIESGDGSLALRLGGVAWTFWKLRGHLSEGRRWLEQALVKGEGSEIELIEPVVVGAADLAASHGDLERARFHLEKALALTRELHDDRAAASALTQLASLPHKWGDPGAAAALFEEGLELSRRSGDWLGAAHALASLALIREDQGDRLSAEGLAEEALAAGRRSGDSYAIGDALLTAGELAINRYEPERARQLLREALELGARGGLTAVEAWALSYLGKLALEEGDVKAARELLEAGRAQFAELRVPAGQSWALRHLGRLASREDDQAAAGKRLDEALRLAVTGVQSDVPLVLEAMATRAWKCGDPDRAAMMAGAAGAQRRTLGLRLPDSEQAERDAMLGSLRDAFGEEKVAELLAAGAAMSVEEAVELAARS